MPGIEPSITPHQAQSRIELWSITFSGGGGGAASASASSSSSFVAPDGSSPAATGGGGGGGSACAGSTFGRSFPRLSQYSSSYCLCLSTTGLSLGAGGRGIGLLRRANRSKVSDDVVCCCCGCDAPLPRALAPLLPLLPLLLFLLLVLLLVLLLLLLLPLASPLPASSFSPEKIGSASMVLLSSFGATALRPSSTVSISTSMYRTGRSIASLLWISALFPLNRIIIVYLRFSDRSQTTGWQLSRLVIAL